MIGFWLIRFAADPVEAVFPGASAGRGDEPVTSSVAILVCIRNEMPDRVIRNLGPMLDGLASAGVGGRWSTIWRRLMPQSEPQSEKAL